MNRLCGDAPRNEPEEQPPVFSQTVRDHALLLLNQSVAEAFRTI